MARAADTSTGGAKPTIAALARDQDVTAAFQALKDGDAFDVCLADGLEPETIAVIRGHELVPAEAFRVPGVEGPVRFVDEIDLVRVAEVAVAATRVPDAFEAYCRRVSPVPLPHFLSALALLVGKGLLRARLAG
jgi:hypothetical protein